MLRILISPINLKDIIPREKSRLKVSVLSNMLKSMFVQNSPREVILGLPFGCYPKTKPMHQTHSLSYQIRPPQKRKRKYNLYFKFILEY